jgi:hypothetical protein
VLIVDWCRISRSLFIQQVFIEYLLYASYQENSSEQETIFALKGKLIFFLANSSGWRQSHSNQNALLRHLWIPGQAHHEDEEPNLFPVWSLVPKATWITRGAPELFRQTWPQILHLHLLWALFEY